MSSHVKICGLSDEATLLAANHAGAHYIGFVHFPKSPRHVSLERAAELKKMLHFRIRSVVVLVDPDDALLGDVATIVTPDYIQLHGKESPERVREIREKFPTLQIIKAFSVATSADLEPAKDYEQVAHMLMFDAKAPKDATLPGGNGIAFDWHIMSRFKSKLPWILSGGLTPENVNAAIKQSGAQIVDVSSGVEREPGVKDAGKIKRFIQAAHS